MQPALDEIGIKESVLFTCDTEPLYLVCNKQTKRLLISLTCKNVLNV